MITTTKKTTKISFLKTIVFKTIVFKKQIFFNLVVLSTIVNDKPLLTIVNRPAFVNDDSSLTMTHC